MNLAENRLITIPISHYCEKARWALERAQIQYFEERHLQAFHFRPVYRASKTDSTPVLVTNEGVFSDSTDILKWCDTKVTDAHKLYPSDPKIKEQVEKLEDYFDEGLGVDGRLWMYTFMLNQVPVLLKYSKLHGVPWYEKLLMPVLFPLMKSFVKRTLEVKPTSRTDTHAKVDIVFNEVGKILSDGRKFLIGNQFTAADLTFAALSAAVLIPEDYGVVLPKLEELPKEMSQQIQIWRKHPAGEFAYRIYKEFRTK